MKRFFAIMILMTMFVCMCTPVQATGAVMKQFYVNPNTGSDNASGTAAEPFLTIEKAQKAVREYIEANGGVMTGDIVVNLAEGRYELTEYLQLREEDSGNNGFDVVYQGAGAKKSVISGGTQISGWEKGENGLWTADAPQLEYARDMYVNERAARRAASQTKIKGVANYHDKNSYYDTSDGFYVNKSQMQKFNNPEDVVLHWTYAWQDSQICVKDIIDDPNNSEQLIVKLENPTWNGMVESAATSSHPQLIPTYNKDFVVENALELLDEPGEFYFDKKLKKMYYYPLEGEDMQTAQVIVPRLERLVRIDGSNYHHQVTSVAFRDIGFAHATNPLGENTSYNNQQGECPTSPQQAANRTPGAFEVNWANNIEISDCAVWGTELVGIFFNEGVSDSSVTGTSITDTGSAAAVIGNVRTTTGSPSANATVMGNPQFPDEFANAANLANVIYLKRWRASYNYVIGGTNAMHFFNGGSLGNEFEYRSGTAASGINAQTWRNEPWAERDGIKSWVMFDLEKEYNLEYIRLSFEEDCAGVKATEQEKSNFEVLLSNDEDFEDYVVVKTFTEAAADVEMFNVDVEGKYRYLMIRKTVPEPFAIYGVWAYSGDREPIGTYGLCQNITFENNYIARAARTHNQAPAVLVHLTKEVDIRHNDILDSGYIGISLGWGWKDVNYSTNNNVIENNLIDGFCLSANDGGGIYILGNQRNLQIKGNYVKNQGNMYGGIYFDEGASNAIVKNNVILNTSNTFMFWNDVNEISTGNIILSSNYSDMSQVARYEGDAYIKLEDINVFTPDSPPDEAVSIMTTAGLQGGYRYLRESERLEAPWLKGPEMSKSYHRTDDASTRALAFQSVAENLLENAQFGTFPWQYSYEDYYKIEKALADIKDSTNRTTDYSNGHILEEYALKAAIENANEGIEHLPYEDIVGICEEKLGGATTDGTIGSYPQTAVTALQSAFDKEKAAAPSGEVEKALAANRLEKAISIFENSRISADLEYAYIEGGETTVDAENRTTTITLPFDTSLSGLEISTNVSEGATLVTNVSSVNFNQPISLTIKNSATGQTAQWTLVVTNEDVAKEQDLVFGSDAESLINYNPNTVIPVNESALNLQPTNEPYVYNTVAEDSVKWRICVDEPEKDKGVSMLFGGKRKNLQVDVKEKNNSFFRLVLLGQTMTLYYVEDGTETSVASNNNVNFIYGVYNDIKVTYENNCLNVYVNDAEVMEKSGYNASKFQGYCGVYNPATIVSVYRNYQAETTTLTNVALNRMVTTSWTNGENEPIRMVDGQKDTSWISNKFTFDSKYVISGRYIWALIDLGAAYTIDEIKVITPEGDDYISRDRQDYKVYVTNKRPETNVVPDTAIDVSGMTQIYSAPSLANGTNKYAPAENIIDVSEIKTTVGNRYRYVLLQKSNILDEGNGTGMEHWSWNIAEVEVNTYDKVDEDAPYWKEIAKNRPVFSGAVNESDTYAARNVIDGDISTVYIAGDWGNGIRSRLVIDLEEEYPIEAVVYTPRYASNELKGFEIYATNDILFEDMKLIHKQPLSTEVNYGHLYYKTPEVMEGNNYRYVVIQADSLNNNLGILDVKVYTSEREAEQPSIVNRTYVVSTNNPVTTDGKVGSNVMSQITDTKSSTAGTMTSSNTKGAYISVDLLKPQTVDYVTYAIKNDTGTYHYGLEIVASNNADLSDGVVMYSAKDENGDWFCPVSETDTKGIILFPATKEMEGNKYRYVGMRFPYNTKTNLQMVRGSANMFEVYTKGINLQESMSGAEISQNGAAFTLTLKDLLTHNNSTYTFIGAAYDSTGILLDVKTAEIAKPTQRNRHTTPITATVDFFDYKDLTEIKDVKTMLWESISNIRPIVELNHELDRDSYAAVKSSARTTSYYARLMDSGWTVNYRTDVSATVFTDNDSSTRFGRGQGGDVAWIDLGEEKMIDAVKVQVNDEYMATPTSPMIFYVTNDDPLESLKYGTDSEGYFTPPSSWVAVNGTGHIWTEQGISEATYEMEECGEYRYVVVLTHGEDLYTETGLKAYVSEIIPYVKLFLH